jgi:hypothetical protein
MHCIWYSALGVKSPPTSDLAISTLHHRIHPILPILDAPTMAPAIDFYHKPVLNAALLVLHFGGSKPPPTPDLTIPTLHPSLHPMYPALDTHTVAFAINFHHRSVLMRHIQFSIFEAKISAPTRSHLLACIFA